MSSTQENQASTTAPATLRIALDWTPNTLHTGLYLAQHHSFYSDENLTVHLLPPDKTYTTTPAKQLANNDADLAIVPSDSVIAYNETGRLALQAIYAICRDDASAIAISPRLVDGGAHGDSSSLLLRALGDKGGVYGSYNAKYEDAIVRAMVTGAGGAGEKMKIESSTGKFSLFDKVIEGNGEVDATWIFRPWEGFLAEMESEEAQDGSVKFRAFGVRDSGVPYGYSPLIARLRDDGSRKTGVVNADVLRRFVRATRKGYEMALQQPEESSKVLMGLCDPKRSEEFLLRSQKMLNRYYGQQGQLGLMEEKVWVDWVKWLREKGLLGKELDVKELYTNEFF